MNSHQGTWLLVATCFIYLSVHFSTVSGKCRGKWSIHACLGGNGKRSGPPSALTSSNADDDSSNRFLLQQLLLQSAAESPNLDSFSSDDLEQFYPEKMSENSSPMATADDLMPEASIDLESLSELVKELMFRKKLKKLQDAAGLV